MSVVLIEAAFGINDDERKEGFRLYVQQAN